MFRQERWVGAFFAVSGENADAVFLSLKTLAASLKSVRGIFSGYNASLKIEKLIRESVGIAEDYGPDTALEFAIRFICLLVEKKGFKHIDVILKKIEQALNERKGILSVTVESASAPETGFEEALVQSIKLRTGVESVKVSAQVKPELLGGYLLRIGDFYVDASLRGQLENMRTELMAAVEGMPDGGDNGEL
jgi:F-type H+-transporting ATPase subunit delta